MTEKIVMMIVDVMCSVRQEILIVVLRDFHQTELLESSIRLELNLIILFNEFSLNSKRNLLRVGAK